MVKKITESAYFIVDVKDYCASINLYDPVLANQTICYEVEESPTVVSLDEPSGTEEGERFPTDDA